MDEADRTLVDSCRRAVLATIDETGRPRLVPICFAIAGDAVSDVPLVVYSPLDEKPKRVSDARRLARVTDIEARPDVTLLFDRWSEDWSELGWVRVRGVAALIDPDGDDAAEHRAAVTLLRARYPQYATQAIDRAPIIRVAVAATRSWRSAG